MPYITKKRANEIQQGIAQDLGLPIGTDTRKVFEVISNHITNGGELNWLISTFLARRFTDLGVSYENLKSVYGDASLAAEEFRERLIVPYETIKMQDDDNADPYFDMFLKVTKRQT